MPGTGHCGGKSKSIGTQKNLREWGSGVVDLRPRKNMVTGKLMRNAIREAETMIRNIPCEHKIGMCRCPHERFWCYQEPNQSWKPWLMGLLASADTREGAFTMEASLIFYFEHDGLNINNNYNWTVSKDYGGEGPIRQCPYEAPEPHFVYIALKPLPPQTDHERRMADFVKSFQAPTAASAQADASAHAAASAQADASTHAAASAQAEAQGPWANAAEWGQHDEEEIADWFRMEESAMNIQGLDRDGEEEVQLLEEVSNDGYPPWYREGEELSLEF